MHLAFDAKRIFHNTAGLGSYSRNLLAALMKYYPEASYSYYNPKPGKIEFKIPNKVESNIIYPTGISKHFSSLWRSRGIAKDLEKLQPDLFHGLSHELPFGIEKTSVKSVVTMHDLIFVRHPEWYKKIDVKLYTKKYKHACKVTNCIVAIGEQTKQDLIDFWGIDAAKIEIVRQGCHPRFWQKATTDQIESLKVKYMLPDRFMLQVGTIEARKNHLTSLEALSMLKTAIPLVIVGRGKGYKNVLTEFIQEHQLDDRVLFLHDVSNEEIPVLYQMADLSIYPSYFEGFGIPVLESIVSETPVITTNKQCFRDAGGDAAIYIDPEQPKDLVEAIEQILSNTDYYKAVVEKGKIHAQDFTEEVVAMNMMNVYKKVLKT